MNQTKPLAHLTVLDFSAVYAGPICSRLLADCGANVIKVEATGAGDLTRGPKGTSRVFSHFNAGKQSIALNLKQAEGQRVAHQLLESADVVIENFRPGVMQQFGLDYANVVKARSDLVYCSISGFGQKGPMAQRAAYAPIAHAASGFDIAHARGQRDPNADPSVWSIMIADMLTGTYAFGAIQTALLGRTQSGKGDYIDVTMMESMMSLIPGQIQLAQIPDAPPVRGFHPVRTQDGFVMICIVSGKNMRTLCEAMERPDMLNDPRFAFGEHFKNQPLLLQEIENWSTQLSTDACEQALNATGVPCSRYNSPEDLFDHPQLQVRQSFTEQQDEYGAFLIQNAPFTFTGVNTATSCETPTLGQHTDEILGNVLKYSAEDIAQLRKVGAIG
jgi:crotonobetainyl-CoA:carnitine CoA-transferase CaiB-like acyl-CoA transferase